MRPPLSVMAGLVPAIHANTFLPEAIERLQGKPSGFGRHGAHVNLGNPRGGEPAGEMGIE